MGLDTEQTMRQARLVSIGMTFHEQRIGSEFTWSRTILGSERNLGGDFFDMSPWPNKSPEPTAVGAGSSAIAVHVASRRWLSFLR